MESAIAICEEAKSMNSKRINDLASFYRTMLNKTLISRKFCRRKYPVKSGKNEGPSVLNTIKTRRVVTDPML